MACKPFPKCRFFFSVTRLENYKWKNIQPCHQEKTSKIAPCYSDAGQRVGWSVSSIYLHEEQDRAGRVSDGKRWTGSYLAKASCRPLRRSSKNPLLNRPKTFLLVGNGGSFLKVTKA